MKYRAKYQGTTANQTKTNIKHVWADNLRKANHIVNQKNKNALEY